MDFDPRTSIGANQNKVTNLARRAAGKAFFVSICVRPHLDDEQYGRQHFFKVHRLASLDQAAFILFINLRKHAQEVICRWVGKLFGFFLICFIEDARQIHGLNVKLSHRIPLLFAGGRLFRAVRSTDPG